tara:strand:- start:2578 stop:3000 length:423 start_codon:yes stop_codon:yes gene_type:complete
MAVISMCKVDNAVSIDGNGQEVDLSGLASNIWAIQWNGSSGEIEYTDGTANETISDMSPYSAYTDAHATAKATEDAAIAAEASAEATRVANQNALEATYGWKRQQEYPSIGDQLDSLYKAGTFDSTMTAAILAIKEKYPK